MTGAIMWALGLTIGALFGFVWGWTAGQRSVVIALPDAPDTPYPESGQHDST